MSIIFSVKTIQRPFDFSIIDIKAPFACFLYSSQNDLTHSEMMSVANWLVSSGCSEVICAGSRCSEWHNEIDSADIIHNSSTKIPVTTALREDDAAEVIIWHWLEIIRFQDIIFENCLGLLIGSSSEIEGKVLTAFKNNPFSL